MKSFPVKLPQEAKLLGTWSFITKASIAMFVGFALGRYIPLVNRDMISFLFAMILSLEPVSSTGFKRGLDQFRATLIGGLLSGLIVVIVGINPLGLALSIAAILYFTLAKDWRNMSVVALFTGIYMTQYVQLSPQGTPDILLTMAVRILALTTGIGFAMAFNALISVIYMRRMPAKRLCFINYRLQKHVSRVADKLSYGLPIEDKDHLSMSNLFNDIDWNLSLLRDLETDPLLALGRLDKSEVSAAIKTANGLRTFCHYLFDLEIQLRDVDFSNFSPQVLDQLIAHLKEQLIDFSNQLELCSYGHADVTLSKQSPKDKLYPFDTPPHDIMRILHDLQACSQILDDL